MGMLTHFSLKTLLVTCPIAAFLIALVHHFIQQESARLQLLTVIQIEEAGGSVIFDKDNNVLEVVVDSSFFHSSDAWLYRVSQKLEAIQIRGPINKPANLKLLPQSLVFLEFETGVDGLRYLPELHNVLSLTIFLTQESNLRNPPKYDAQAFSQKFSSQMQRLALLGFNDDVLANCNHMTDLRSLTYSGATFTGRGFSNWHEAEGLESLTFSGQISDESMLAFPICPRLRHLRITSHELKGHGLEWLKNSPSINQIFLGGKQIQETAFVKLASISELKSLEISDAIVSAVALNSLGRAKNLRSLSLINCDLTDTSLQDANPLTGIRQLTIKHSAITADGLRFLPQFENLEYLELVGVELTDSGWALLSLPTSLRTFRVTSSRDLYPATRLLKVRYPSIEFPSQFFSELREEAPELLDFLESLSR